MKLPFSWLSRGSGGSVKPWWRRAPGVLLAAGITWLAFVGAPWLVFGAHRYELLVAWVGIAELVGWVLPAHTAPGLLQHAARFGIWLGWPLYVEVRFWRIHLYAGWEPLGQTNEQFDLSARLILHE